MAILPSIILKHVKANVRRLFKVKKSQLDLVTGVSVVPCKPETVSGLEI